MHIISTLHIIQADWVLIVRAIICVYVCLARCMRRFEWTREYFTNLFQIRLD